MSLLRVEAKFMVWSIISKGWNVHKCTSFVHIFSRQNILTANSFARMGELLQMMRILRAKFTPIWWRHLIRQFITDNFKYMSKDNSMFWDSSAVLNKLGSHMKNAGYASEIRP